LLDDVTDLSKSRVELHDHLLLSFQRLLAVQRLALLQKCQLLREPCAAFFFGLESVCDFAFDFLVNLLNHLLDGVIRQIHLFHESRILLDLAVVGILDKVDVGIMGLLKSALEQKLIRMNLLLQLAHDLCLLHLNLLSLCFFFVNSVPQKFDFCIKLYQINVCHLVQVLLRGLPVFL